MRRRRALALLGAGTAGIAGCIAPPSTGTSPMPAGTPTRAGPPPPGTTRRVPMGTTVEVDDARATVGNPRVRKAVVVRGAHTYVVAHAGQYVVVDVTTDGTAPRRREDLRSSVGGVPLDDGDPLPTGEGRYAFPFPAERHEAAAVRWATGRSAVYWELPAAVRETLAAEPWFRVEDLAVPRRDGDLALDLTAANGGDRDGRFVARVSFDAFSGGSVVEFVVPAGESRRYSGRPGKTLLYFENNGGGTLTVRYPGDDGLARSERDVAVPGTPTGSTT